MSAARVVYDYYGGAERFPTISDEMMDAVDKADAAQFSEDEILDPQGWILLTFLMDPRTGLGRFREFRISNYQLMMQLIDDCTRADASRRSCDARRRRARRSSTTSTASARSSRSAAAPQVDGNLVVLDLARRGGHLPDQPLHDLRAVSRHEHLDPRALGPQAAEHGVRHRQVDHQPLVTTNVGELMLAYGGGGHDAAGTCQVANDGAGIVLADLSEKITADG